MTDGPLHAYRALVDGGEITADASQQRAAENLQDLHEALAGYAPAMGAGGWKARLMLGPRRPEPPRGIYLHGGVGRGKSMLMDLFFDASTVEARKAVHFHAFMREVHTRVHAFGQAVKAGRAPDSTDPLAALSRVIVDRAWLLCFDEFHVSDIADAMILGRLFEALFDAGVVVVTTSNRPPRDLYKGGLQRASFLPFIDLLEDKLDVVEVDNGVDHRLRRLRAMNVYMVPAGAGADRELEKDFRRLITGAHPRPEHFSVHGREVDIALAAEGVAFTAFTDLCAKPLGAADYLGIAERYHTVLISGIPRMAAENRNEAKRFVTLIDILYDHRVNLICSADAPPGELYTAGDGSFEFERTASRLIEMQSQAYLAEAHVP